jgi:hypothetical protein
MVSQRRRAVLCALASLIPVRSHAESASNNWQWGATVYLWLPILGGETSFPADGGVPAIDIGVDNFLDSINFIFMGALEGHRGRWGLSTDVIYLDLGTSESKTRDSTCGVGFGRWREITPCFGKRTSRWM